MNPKLVNIGYGNLVAIARIVAVVTPESAPVKRIVAEARDSGLLVDATCGRRMRAVIVTDSRHVILSALQPETIGSRVNDDGTPS